VVGGGGGGDVQHCARYMCFSTGRPKYRVMGEISSFDPYSTNTEKYHMVGDRGVIFVLWLHKWRSLFSEARGGDLYFL
jgi:hypothetical protein